MITHTIAIDLMFMTGLHVTALEPGRYDPKTGRTYRGSDDANLGIPCALTRMSEIARQEPKTVNARIYNTMNVPVIPGNTIDGRLRRKAADLIIESLIEKDQKLSTRAYNTLTSGTAGAELARALVGIEATLAAKADPYLGLFGGTAFAFERRVITSDALPVIEETLPLLMAPPQTAQLFGDDRLSVVVHTTRKDDVLDMRNPAQLASAVGAEAVADYVEAIHGGRADKKTRKAAGDDSGKKTELSSNTSYETAMPGLHFALRLGVKSVTEAHLGLLLLALQRFANEGQIGGKAAQGCGRFSVTSARVFKHDGFARSEFGLDFLTRDAGGRYLIECSNPVDDAVGAAQDYLARVESRSIEAFANGDIEKFMAGAG